MFYDWLNLAFFKVEKKTININGLLKKIVKIYKYKNNNNRY